MKGFAMVDDSSSFHTTAFKPGASTVQAATWISICESWKEE